MTRAADLLSRSEIWQVISLNTIPVDQLELLAQKAAKEIFPKNFLVQPHMLVSYTFTDKIYQFYLHPCET